MDLGIHENLEDQMNEFQVNYVEGVKDDLDINLDEILTSFDLKVNNLTSKFLKIEKKMEDFTQDKNEIAKRMEDMEKVIGRLVFKYNDLKEKEETKKYPERIIEAPISISRIPNKNKDNEKNELNLKENNENLEKPEDKLQILFRIRDDLIKKYKSGEIERDVVEENLKKIETKINYYKEILIQ